MMENAAKWGRFGWYNMIAEAANLGRFNAPNLTPQQSVMRANFWELLIALAREVFMAQ